MSGCTRVGLAIRVVGLVLAGSFAAAAEAPSDPAGTWQLRVTAPGRPPQESTLKLEKADNAYVGVLTNSQGRSALVKDVRYKDGALTFKAVLERQGQSLVLEYQAKIAGDRLKGTVALEVAERKLRLELAGQRADVRTELLGLWKISLTLESGKKVQPSLVLKSGGAKLSGEYIGSSGKRGELRAIKLERGVLTFQASDRVESETAILHYAGRAASDVIRGTVKLTLGNRTVSRPFEARRSATPTADVNGTWKLRVPLKTGPTIQPTVQLVQTGRLLSGTYQGDRGATAIGEAVVLGDEVTFEVARERDGKRYRLRYQARVSGDSLKGTVDYHFDGISGYVDFEGKRVTNARTPSP